MTVSHNLINTGSGWRCLGCGLNWDQGEDTDSPCNATDDYGFVTDLSQPVDPIDFPQVVEIPSLPDTPAVRAYVEQIGSCFPEGMPRASVILATSAPVLDVSDGDIYDLMVKREPTFKHQFVTTPQTALALSHRDMQERLKPATMTKQVAGTHYAKLAIQPTEFCMRNGLDFCIGSILKYITRHRAKNGVEDLRKAAHFVEIRQAFDLAIYEPRHVVITMLEYVTRNNVTGPDAEALYRLEAYYNAEGRENRRVCARRLTDAINNLIVAC
jgi:hypothetical protein